MKDNVISAYTKKENKPHKFMDGNKVFFPKIKI